MKIDLNENWTLRPTYMAQDMETNGSFSYDPSKGELKVSRFLPESNAACVYLAAGSPLIPTDRFDHADMLRWMFWEQYNHEPNVATLRFWHRWIGEANFTDAQRAALPGKYSAGAAALQLLDDHLATRAWFVGDAMSLADIVLYPYTHVAEDGGFRLADYTNVQAWLARIAMTPGWVAMDA